jgi:integration host factor subunit beta
MGAVNNTVTKRDIIERISSRTTLKRADVKEVVQLMLEEIIGELGEGRRIEFREFGVFEVRPRKARTAQNPKTLEPVPVPAKNAVKFKPGRRMKEAMDGGAFAHVGDNGRVAEINITTEVAEAYQNNSVHHHDGRA